MTRSARREVFGDCRRFAILSEGLPGLGVFGRDNMKNFYLDTVREKAEAAGVSVLAYCVLDNHAHLAVSCGDSGSVPEFMRRVNTSYAKFYNRLNGRSGYVFNGRYGSECLETAEDVRDAISFIHLNPVREGLCSSCASYAFSSARDYPAREGFVDYAALEDVLGGVPGPEDPGSGRKFAEVKPDEDCDSVLRDLIKRYSITDLRALQDPELLKTMIYELQTRSGVSLRDVAIILGVDREKIRRTALKINYDR